MYLWLWVYEYKVKNHGEDFSFKISDKSDLNLFPSKLYGVLHFRIFFVQRKVRIIPWNRWSSFQELFY